MFEEPPIHVPASDLPASFENRYRAAFHGAADGMALVIDSVIIDCNRAVAEMLGIDRKDLIGLPPLELPRRFSPEYQPGGSRSNERAEAISDAALAGEHRAFDWRFERADGTPFDARVLMTSLDLVEGRGTLVVIRDVTAQRRGAEALRTSEERFRTLLEGSSEAIFLYEYDPPLPVDLPVDEQVERIYDGVVVLCNDTWARRCGVSASHEVVGRRVGDLFATPRDGLDRLFRALVEGDYRVIDGEAVEVMPDGTRHHYLSNYYGIVEAEGLRWIWGTSRDVTEARSAQEALKRERDRATHYLDMAGTMIVALNAEGRITLMNRKGLDILGCQEAEVIGRSWFESFVPPSVRDEVKDVFAKIMAGDVVLLESYENSVVTLRGEERLLFWHNSLLYDGEGRVVGTLSSGEDITERRRAEENLRVAYEEIRELKEQIEAENVYLREEIRVAHLHGDMVAQSESARHALAAAEQVAPTPSTVLILGETGTGKEVLARAIHSMSPRREKPLVVVNCAAIPSALVESELFGREKGAYTGALTRQMGRFEVADGSTIFLDELGELPPETQVKLLRFLQEGEFERLGSTETTQVDVRVIAATNRDLEAAVAEGSFRQDLFYRLNVFPITVPPLRERAEDIPPLVWAFVNEFGDQMGRRIESIPRPTMDALGAYAWPGNVRELRNVIERAMIQSTGPTLQVELPTAGPRSEATAALTLAEVERRHLLRVLESTDWRIRGQGGAAEVLGMKPTTLNSRLKKHGIRRPS